MPKVIPIWVFCIALCFGPISYGQKPGAQNNAPVVAKVTPKPKEVTNRIQAGVNLNNGNFHALVTHGFFRNEPLPIMIATTHNSRSNYEGSLGYGVSTLFDTQLWFYPDGAIVLYVGGGGRSEVFLPSDWNTRLAAAVNSLMEKLKKEDPTRTESYLAKVKQDVMTQETTRLRLFRDYFPSDVQYVKGVRFDHRSRSDVILERTPLGGFQYVSPNQPIWAFDTSGNLTGVKDPASASVWTLTWKKTKEGFRLVSISDADKYTARVTYQEKNPAIQSIVLVDPQQRQTVLRFEYQKQGPFNLLAASVDGDGNRIVYGYSSEGNLTEVRYMDGTREQIAYDSKKDWVQRYQKWDGSFATYQFLVDSANPLRQTVSVASYTKDKKSIPPTENIEYLFKRRSLDQSVVLASMKETRGNEVKFTQYNECCNLPVSMEVNGVRSTWDYDQKERVTTRKDPSGVTTFSYMGNETRPSSVVHNGVAYGYSYDVQGRTRSAKGPEGEFEVQYDPAGHMRQMTNKKTATMLRFEYNTLGQPTKIVQEGTGEMIFRYSDVGVLLELTPRSFRDDVSPIMLANQLTRNFVPYVSVMAMTALHPLLDSPLNAQAFANARVVSSF